MLELVWLLFATVLAWVRPRHDLVLETLLLRHQLAVLTRPTRSRRMLGFATGTSCCGSWLAVSAPVGASILHSSHPIRSSAGIDRAGACSGAGSHALAAAGHISVPRYAS